MKISILTIVLTLLATGCATTAPKAKTGIDDLLNTPIVAPPPPKPVEEKKAPATKPSTTIENVTELAAFLGTDVEDTMIEPICTATDLRPLAKPVRLEVISFELSDETEGNETAEGAHMLRTCCEVRKSLVENDSRFPAECTPVAKKNHL